MAGPFMAGESGLAGQDHGSATDVLVIGAGLAGSTAALKAASLGARVMLLDACADSTAGGNTPLSGGSIHVGHLHPSTAPDDLRDRVNEMTSGLARADLVDALCAHAGPAFRWLGAQGVQFESTRPEDSWKAVLAPWRELHDVDAWPGKGPNRTLAVLQGELLRRGGAITRGVMARELVAGVGPAAAGVVTVDGRVIRAAKVILADGGFHADARLRARYIGPAADQILIRGAQSGHGTALRMAVALGAKPVGMQWFYGHCLHRSAMDNSRLWPWPALDGFLSEGILVDRAGRRIADEGLGGIATANTVARGADPLGTSVILDEEAWNAAGRAPRGRPAANPGLELRGGVVHRAHDVEQLARVAGIDPVGLAQTVSSYTAAVSHGRAGELAVPRTGNGRPLTGPLFAIPMVPGITFTMGGPLVDGTGRVLDENEQPVGGLFAAGGAVGGLMGGPLGGYVGGLAHALVSGLLAGETAAGELRAAAEPPVR
jgi:fumarate reductase flavoprotein subunit